MVMGLLLPSPIFNSLPYSYQKKTTTTTTLNSSLLPCLPLQFSFFSSSLSWRGRLSPLRGGFVAITCAQQVGGPFTTPLPAVELQSSLGCKGLLQFVDAGGGATFVDMRLPEKAIDGSSSRPSNRARISVPDALILSYQACMWHGGAEEMLHAQTTPTPLTPMIPSSMGQRTQRRVEDNFEGNAVRGGIALSFFDTTDGREKPLLAGGWFVESATVKPNESIQVTLRCVQREKSSKKDGIKKNGIEVHAQYAITLTKYGLSSAISLTNKSHSAIEYSGSVLNHLSVSRVEAASVMGLKGCNFVLKSGDLDESKPAMLWGLLNRFGLDQGIREAKDATSKGKKGEWMIEKDNYVNFRSGRSKLYTMPSQCICLLDRGLRRSLYLDTVGFKNLLLTGPEPSSTLKDKGYICIGSSCSNEPVVLPPGKSWAAGQMLQNPNSLSEV